MQSIMTPPEFVDRLKLGGRPKSRLFLLLGVASVLSLVAIFFVFTQTKMHNPSPAGSTKLASAPVVTVSWQPVMLIPVSNTVVASGTVFARHSVDIGSEVSGLRVVQVNVDEGAVVHRGEILAKLNSDLLEAQLAREQANLAGAYANVEKARQPNRPEDILGLRAAYQQAKAAVSQADANIKRGEANVSNLRIFASRFESLRTQGAVSEQDALDKKTAANMAEQELSALRDQLEASRFSAKQAEERLKAAQAGGRAVDVSISQSNVSEIQANIRQIQAQLAQAVIKAPSDGVISKRNAEVGEIPTLGQALFTLAKDGILELRAQVQEIDLPSVRVGCAVTITPAATGLSSIMGTVRQVSPVVDAKTRLGVVYIDVPASSGLKEGMYASASIVSGTHMASAIPSRAVVAENDAKAVYVISGDKAVRREIKIGTTSGDLVEVKDGLKGDERIIVGGAGFLKDGDTVRVLTEQGTGASVGAGTGASEGAGTGSSVGTGERVPMTVPTGSPLYLRGIGNGLQ